MKGRRVLRRVGFFQELPHGDHDGQSMAESRSDEPGVDEDRLVGYLSAGVPYIVSPGVVFDVLDRSGPVGSGSVLTDGEWAWPDDLPHYVERYHVRLPAEFVEHARRNDWSIAELGNDELRKLSVI